MAENIDRGCWKVNQFVKQNDGVVPDNAKKEKILFHESDSDDTGVMLGLEMTALLHDEKSPFQHLKVWKHDILGTMLTLDDVIQTTELDEYIYNEMIVQIPILGNSSEGYAKSRQEKDVSIVVIGGGDGGCLREVLKHSWVKEAFLVEIDQAVVDVSKKFLSFDIPWDGPRSNVIITDGAAWIKEKLDAGIRFDAVIIDSTDPIGPGESLFTDEFYTNVYNVLKPHGVMCQQTGLPFFTSREISGVLARLRTIYGKNNAEVYSVCIPSYAGGPMGFVSCTKDGSTCKKPVEQYDGRYYNPEIHSACFALPNDWKSFALPPKDQ